MDTATLPDNPEALKAIIFDQNAAILDQKERYESRIEYLEERVRFLIKEIFGRSSEKRPQPDNQQQLHLFNEAESLVAEEKTEPVTVPGYARQKPKRKPLPQYLPRVEVIHDIDDEEKVCECGEPLSRIGEEVSEKLDIIPAKVR
ncbi:MAG: IS66 family transposase zinc-finger binding domain-containing protein, partial [Syntrophobacteraceae bacterium]